MSRHFLLSRAGLPLLLLSFGLLPFAYGQDTKAPEWKHGLEFPVRKADENTVTKDTKRYGAEVFIDRNLGNVIYISETGAVSALPGSAAPAGKDIKDPSRSHALVLKARKGGEKDFDKAQKFGVEVYKDENNGKLVYISETGSLAAGTGNTASGEPKKPTWSHGLDLKVRKGTQDNFDENTKKWGVECYKDENTGLLVYVSESGAVAVAAGSPPAGDIKGPKWSHGFNFRVRQAGESSSTKGKVIGCEVFHDPNTNLLVYITENGDIAVTPGTPSASAETKKPIWLHGMDFKVRKAGEKGFTDATRKWGVEVFRDENSPQVIYVSETGSVAVLPGK
ncbi:MAG TPA: hypothetical protein VFA26_23620 [Gemmataceae bacterium]|nr:hypothetical protein [Gemmataceae bacterium]